MRLSLSFTLTLALYLGSTAYANDSDSDDDRVTSAPTMTVYFIASASSIIGMRVTTCYANDTPYARQTCVAALAPWLHGAPVPKSLATFGSGLAGITLLQTLVKPGAKLDDPSLAYIDSGVVADRFNHILAHLDTITRSPIIPGRRLDGPDLVWASAEKIYHALLDIYASLAQTGEERWDPAEGPRKKSLALNRIASFAWSLKRRKVSMMGELPVRLSPTRGSF